MDTAEVLFGGSGAVSLLANVASYLPDSPVTHNAAIATTGTLWIGLYAYMHFFAKGPESPPGSYRDLDPDFE
jgi:hypothetical protein